MEEIEKEILVLRELLEIYKINIQGISSKFLPMTMVFAVIFIGFGLPLLEKDFSWFLLFFFSLLIIYFLFYHRLQRNLKYATRRAFVTGVFFSKKLLSQQKMKDLMEEIDKLDEEVKKNSNILKNAK